MKVIPVIPRTKSNCCINGIAWDHSQKPMILRDQSVIPAKRFPADQLLILREGNTTGGLEDAMPALKRLFATLAM
jgi:hypothetical protein